MYVDEMCQKRMFIFLCFFVSHQVVPIKNVLCSGAFRDAPSAFVHHWLFRQDAFK